MRQNCFFNLSLDLKIIDEGLFQKEASFEQVKWYTKQTVMIDKNLQIDS